MMTIIAHRCGTDKFPELTIQAAQYSLKAGADYVEMDVRFTRDNQLVISHDDNAKRVYGCDAKISDMTLTEFLALRHKDKTEFPAHTVQDFFKSGVENILFHIKEGEKGLGTLLECIRQYKLEDKVVIGVMSCDDVQVVKNFNPQIRVLAFMRSAGDTEKFASLGADIIRLWESWVSEDSIKEVKALGKKVWIMAGMPYQGSVGYTKDEHIVLWNKLGADGVLLDEIVGVKNLLK